MRNKKLKLTTTQIILAGFLGVIFVGSLLLSLPISSANGTAVQYIDALFTATTATCVTGLVTLTTASTWSLFGQAVILLLIQVGGMGVITVMSGFMIMLNRKIGLANRVLIQDSFNLDTLSGLVAFVKKVIMGTFVIEGVGALLYMFVFVPEFGIKGIWYSVFNSVSAFCNAGIDIISDNSLCNYATNLPINIVTSLLIILGGLGYIVWWDVFRVVKMFPKLRLKCLKRLSLHSKIALFTTAVLIFGGAALIFVFEFNNPLTVKDMNLFDKLQIALFQSVTTRTAGFATIPQQNLTNASSVISLILMFIGGSPVGTAGGVKTVTVAVLLAATIAVVNNKNDVNLFLRRIQEQTVLKSVAVVMMSLIILTVSSVSLSAVTNADFIDIIFETVSATATVGLSRNLTPSLNIAGKIIIIITMYLGRVGPISLAFAFRMKKQSQNTIKNPTESISVG